MDHNNLNEMEQLSGLLINLCQIFATSPKSFVYVTGTNNVGVGGGGVKKSVWGENNNKWMGDKKNFACISLS